MNGIEYTEGELRLLAMIAARENKTLEELQTAVLREHIKSFDRRTRPRGEGRASKVTSNHN